MRAALLSRRAFRALELVVAKPCRLNSTFFLALAAVLRNLLNAPDFARAAALSLSSLFLARLYFFSPVLHGCGGSLRCTAGEGAAASFDGVFALPAERGFLRRSAFPRLGLNSGAGEACERRGGNAVGARAALARGTPPHG